jgi:hypothetical protein
MTVEAKARVLDDCLHLLDDVQAIDKALGCEPQCNWNAVWARIEELWAHVSRAGRPLSRSSSAASSRRRTPRPNGQPSLFLWGHRRQEKPPSPTRRGPG